MLKRSNSGWASKAVELYMDRIVYNVIVLCGNLQPKFMLLLSMASFFLSLENWYISGFTMVIIHTELEEEKNAGVLTAAARQGRWCCVGKVISELPQMLS